MCFSFLHNGFYSEVLYFSFCWLYFDGYVGYGKIVFFRERKHSQIIKFNLFIVHVLYIFVDDKIPLESP
jgi:hypothetical protein